MAKVLTMNSNITCGHQPPGIVSKESAAKLTVKSSPVLLKSSIVGKDINGCSQSSPCKTVDSVDGGEATKLTVEGSAVILEGIQGMTNTKMLLSVVANQDKFTSV